LNWRYVYFVCPLEYLIKKPPVPMKRATVSLKGQIIHSFAKYATSMYQYEYLSKISSETYILSFDTHQPDNPNLCEQGCEVSIPVAVRSKV
jgi:hypothetical protein